MIERTQFILSACYYLHRIIMQTYIIFLRICTLCVFDFFTVLYEQDRDCCRKSTAASNY